MKGRKFQSRKGFNLIEAVVSIAIFLAILIAVLNLTTVFSIQRIENSKREKAFLEIQELSNYIDSLSYTNPCLDNGTTVYCKEDNGTCCGENLKGSDLEYKVVETTINDIKVKKIIITSSFNIKDKKVTIQVEKIKGDWK